MNVKDILWKVYNFKFNLDLGSSYADWVTGKLTALMAVVYLCKEMGYPLSKIQIVVVVISTLIGLYLLGVFLKGKKLYDTEKYVTASKDPVQKEILAAARKINGKP